MENNELKILVSEYGEWNKKLDLELDIARKFIEQVIKECKPSNLNRYSIILLYEVHPNKGKT